MKIVIDQNVNKLTIFIYFWLERPIKITEMTNTKNNLFIFPLQKKVKEKRKRKKENEVFDFSGLRAERVGEL